jgi:hypothetical protein
MSTSTRPAPSTGAGYGVRVEGELDAPHRGLSDVLLIAIHRWFTYSEKFARSIRKGGKQRCD